MIKRGLFSLALVAALAVPMQTQAQVAGTYTVTGSSGAWFYNFAFTASDGFRPYRFEASGVTETSSTASGWSIDTCNSGWSISNCSFPGVFADGIVSGTTLGGFLGTSSAAAAMNTVGVEYFYGDDNDPNGCCGTGTLTATRVNVSVPEPGSMMLLATGMFGLVGIRRRRQNLNEEV